MQSVLKNVPDDRVRTYFVWMPLMQTDDRASAEQRSKEFTDDRVTHYWDGDRVTGRAWNSVLKTTHIAWDVYLIYAPSTQWEKNPPAPTFWMHQLQKLDHAPRFDKTIFEAKLKEALPSSN